MFLYYQDELYMGPLAVDAIKVIIEKYKKNSMQGGGKDELAPRGYCVLGNEIIYPNLERLHPP